MRDVPVRRDIEYALSADGPLTMDLYAPPGLRSTQPLPAVVLVGGYRDVGVPLALGCPAKEMEMVISWAQLIAVSGLLAISYTRQDPVRDVQRLFQFVGANADSLGVDVNRIGVWAASGNGPVALSLLMNDAPVKVACAVLCYAFTLDASSATSVAEASATWHFANPTAGRTVADMHDDIPLFIARAGADAFQGLNTALDLFVQDALARNLPLTIVNAPQAPHAFDLFDDTDASRHIVELVLAFLRHHLKQS